MDEAFANLEDISDEQTLERLESLFESSLPPLDSPILNDDNAGALSSTDHDAVNILGSLDTTNDLFGSTANNSNYNSMHQSYSSNNSEASTPAAPAPMPSPAASLPPPSPVSFKPLKSPIVAPPSSSPLPSPAQVFYAAKSPQSQPQGGGQQQLILNANTVQMQPIFQAQFALQTTPSRLPTVTSTSAAVVVGGQKVNSGCVKQPHLLPKPSSSVVTSSGNPRLINTAAVTTPFVLNTGGVLTTSQTGSPLLVGTGQPFFIQQPAGNPLIVLRQSPASAASAAPTILPIVSQGQIFLQQPTQAITAQPQVKIITPQGRMQMQQIQTPTGPKLIAVPVGQAANLQQQPQLVTTVVSSIPTMGGLGITTTTSSNSSMAFVAEAIKKKVKGNKNKKNKAAAEKSSLDLGELMKDVGLDLDGFGDEQQQQKIITSTTASALSLMPQHTPTVTLAPTNSHLLTSIQQPLPLQPAPSGQLQLVQGPDGQYMLQSAQTGPTILTQTALTGDALGQSLSIAGTPTPLLAASGNVIGTATPLGPSAVVAAAVAAASASAVSNTTVIAPQQTSMAVTTVSSQLLQSPSRKASSRPTDPNRTPMYVDDRLPPGWHRKVSQRKSGASAGRFEVFIIGPTGKRFRSRKELKEFFEKTQETSLNPEVFDFTTFGNNNITTTTTSGSQTPTVQPQQQMTFSSQLSMETAEADAQISQLLETLQKDPGGHRLPIMDGGEKVSEFIQSLGAADDDDDDDDDEESEKSSSLSPAPNAKTPERTSGTTGFQASFLNSIASPTSTAQDKGPPAQQVLSKGEVSSLPPTAVPVLTLGGGASTQRRALQNLPQNAKLVRGPNGQYSLQKVQTIELSHEMQTNLRTVQARIQEIERQGTTKTAKDESELAQLQIRQQQILSTGKPVQQAHHQSVAQQVSLTTATSVVSSLNPSSSYLASTVPPASKSIPVPNVSVTKSAPIRYTHTVGNQVISVPPAGSAVVTSSTSTSSPTLQKPATNTTTSGVPPLTDEQKRIVHEFKQKMANLPPDQQAAYIAQHKASLIKQLNFQPTQLQLLRSNHVQLQLASNTSNAPKLQQPNPAVVQARVPNLVVPANRLKPLSLGAGTIKSSTVASEDAASSVNKILTPINKQKKIAWVESQIRKDQHEAINPNYRTPFRSKEDACKRLLRYHVYDELDTSPMEMDKADDTFEGKANSLLGKYNSMLNKYHYLLTRESMRLASSSEEVMLARLWDSDERQVLAREKEDVKNGLNIDVSLLSLDQRDCYTKHLEVASLKTEEENEEKLPDIFQPEEEESSKKRTLEDEEDEEKVCFKFARSHGGNWIKKQESGYDEYESIKSELSRYETVNGDTNQQPLFQPPKMENNDDDDEDSDEEFSLKDVDTERAVGSILDSHDEEDDHDEDVDDDVLPRVAADEEDVVAAAFGTSADSVQNAINGILDTLPQGERIETPDLNNITGFLDSIEDEDANAVERDPVTEAAEPLRGK